MVGVRSAFPHDTLSGATDSLVAAATDRWSLPRLLTAPLYRPFYSSSQRSSSPAITFSDPMIATMSEIILPFSNLPMFW